jgi:Ca-activated chloride channel family protein
MSFESPLALIGLALVPVAVAGYVALQRRHALAAARFVSPALLPNIVDRAPGWRRHLPPAVLLLAVTLLVVGFARPHATISVRSEEATAILAIDTSRSMGATDVAPSRLAAAQASARRFLAELPRKYRVAVIAFGTQAQVVSPPTHDREFVAASLSALRPGEGTAIGDAIATAVKVGRSITSEDAAAAGKKRPPAAVLVLSDGAQDGGRVQPTEAIRRAREAHIPVFTALLGTQMGIVQVPLIGGFVERIQVPPDPVLLRRVAEQTGGRFFETPQPKDLDAVYGDLKSRLSTTRKNTEITVAFAGLAAVLLLVGGGLSAYWFRTVP